MKKGVFITFYGINNIGKTTQVKLLAKNLKKEGHKVKYLKYPIYDTKPSGPQINKILRNSKGKQPISSEELQMWFAVNRFQFEPKLRDYLNKGYIVLAEDYTGTGICWGHTRGIPLDWLEEIHRYILKEDLAIMLDGDRSLAAIEKGHLHEDDAKLMAKSRRVHLKVAKKNRWKIVKRVEGIEKTQALIYKEVDKFLKRKMKVNSLPRK